MSQVISGGVGHTLDGSDRVSSWTSQGPSAITETRFQTTEAVMWWGGRFQRPLLF